MVTTAFPELSANAVASVEGRPTEVLAAIQPPEEETDR